MDFFTGNRDVDRSILLNLSGSDVIRACRLGKYALRLCNENFWFQKIVIDFGINLSKYKDIPPYNEIYVNIVNYINENSLNFNIKTIVMASSYIGYLPVLKELIRKYPELMEKSYIKATKDNQIDILRYLDKKYEDRNDEVYYECLHIATDNCNVEIVSYLYKECNTRTDPLLYEIAAENGCIPVLDILMGDGIGYRLLYDNNLMVALRAAIGGGNIETVKWLVKNKGASIGEDSLYIAVANDKKDIVEYLLRKGADPNKKEYLEGKYVHPLELAVKSNDYDMVLMLLEAGANPKVNNIMALATKKRFSYIADLLKKYGAK